MTEKNILNKENSAVSAVSIIHTSGYEDLKKAIDRHFELLQMENRLNKDMNVLLKPNLLMKRKPEEHTTTHPNLVEAVIVKLKEMGIKNITIADSPGGEYNIQHLDSIYKASGMADVAERQGVILNHDVGFGTLKNPKGEFVKAFDIINPVIEADFIINLPKLKTHGMTLMSGAVKNMFGAIPGLLKPEMHMRFPDYDKFGSMLIDLCEVVKPGLTVIDAVVSMEGDGPSAGKPKATNFTAASCDPYALDMILASIIGISPENVSMINAAVRRGLCKSLNNIELLGDEPEYFEDFEKPGTMHTVDFSSQIPAPAFISNFIAKRILGGFKPKPKIRKKDCIGCGKCAESCPAKIIEIINRKAIIEYEKCISCFCCHEMCPVKAVDIKKSKISSAIIKMGVNIFSRR